MVAPERGQSRYKADKSQLNASQKVADSNHAAGKLLSQTHLALNMVIMMLEMLLALMTPVEQVRKVPNS